MQRSDLEKAVRDECRDGRAGSCHSAGVVSIRCAGCNEDQAGSLAGLDHSGRSSVDPRFRSPRATARTFLIAMNLAEDDPHRIEEAVGCLDLSGIPPDRATAAGSRSSWSSSSDRPTSRRS